MSTTEEKVEGMAISAVAPRVGEADATYQDPDLSYHFQTGELPDEEKAWHEARNAEQEASVEAAEEGEKKAIEERQKLLDEQAAEREKFAATAKAIATAKAAGAQPVVNIDLPS